MTMAYNRCRAVGLFWSLEGARGSLHPARGVGVGLAQRALKIGRFFSAAVMAPLRALEKSWTRLVTN